ncbi:MAG: hypothetical protein ACM3U2_06745 [Deltaproteobacteria bacterium]
MAATSYCTAGMNISGVALPAKNPDHLKSQIEGAVVMRLGGALFEALEFEVGKILNGRFSR